MKFKNFIFDLDGTLVHSFPGIAHSAEGAIRSVLPGRAIPDLIPHIGPPIREVFRTVLRETDAGVLDLLEARFRVDYDAEGWIKSSLYPGVAQALATLCDSGGVCHVLTNKPRTPTLCILQHLGLIEFLSSVVTPDAREPRFQSKQEAAIEMQHLHQMDPSQTLLIGDSADDAMAAAACGFRFAAVDYGYGNVAAGGRYHFDYRLADFYDLKCLLA